VGEENEDVVDALRHEVWDAVDEEISDASVDRYIGFDGEQKVTPAPADDAEERIEGLGVRWAVEIDVDDPEEMTKQVLYQRSVGVEDIEGFGADRWAKLPPDGVGLLARGESGAARKLVARCGRGSR
jgi:hypothetical protein